MIDKTVLTIGAGPSGIDLTYAIAEMANKVIFSHHKHTDNHIVPSNVIKKGAIERFTRNSVIFSDGSEEIVTDVLFCTGNVVYVYRILFRFFPSNGLTQTKNSEFILGFKYVMPFVSDDCGIRIEDNYICPLYKHCINIEHPTMAVIGVPVTIAITQMIDIQVMPKDYCHFITV